jgi:hypothetical protein
MGMYDTINCKYPLPQPEDPKGYKNSLSFQTKDLGQFLSHYEIKEDGSLWIQKEENEYIPGNPNGKSFIEQIGTIKTIKSWWEAAKITNTIEMYDYITSDNTEYDYDIIYTVTIIDGIVTDVKLSEFQTIPNKQRKERDECFKQEHKVRNEFENKWYYKYILKYYNQLVIYTTRFIKSICDKISSSIWTIERKITF